MFHIIKHSESYFQRQYSNCTNINTLCHTNPFNDKRLWTQTPAMTLLKNSLSQFIYLFHKYCWQGLEWQECGPATHARGNNPKMHKLV
jgi:hypothetical protein